MRPSMLALLLPVLIVPPLASQAFEGTVTMDLQVGDKAPTSVKILVKGDKSLTVMTMGQNAGPASGKEVRTITDRGAGKTTVLVPIEMMGSKGMKMVIDLDKMADAKDTRIALKALGTSQTVAGYRCADYELSDNGKPTGQLCITHELGTFIYPSAGPMGRRSGSPAWATAFGGKDAGFPLKVSSVEGKPIMVVTSIQKGHVPSDAFDIPEGYMDMPSMGGRGRGGF